MDTDMAEELTDGTSTAQIFCEWGSLLALNTAVTLNCFVMEGKLLFQPQTVSAANTESQNGLGWKRI